MNEGNAMNLTSGKFTAPQTGICFFSFTGLMKFTSSTIRSIVSFYLNRNQIGKSLVEEGNIGENPNDKVTLQSTINLKKGDQVWLEVTISSGAAYLHDESSNHYTHYTGFMLEEDIVSTL